ncbi:hypothetical protein DASC09_002930 [Saccharomycopsis crataegensis]|uniref:C3HC-type domain-containing protein n=1 Tax=Saccharomycopsis crataegensis TaxID=43959 RepID=A0AAV5QFK3_9ASCO|nr:hypothetical protein DASC09_002930 [Saccharomycopsis crataegensis]
MASNESKELQATFAKLKYLQQRLNEIKPIDNPGHHHHLIERFGISRSSQLSDQSRVHKPQNINNNETLDLFRSISRRRRRTTDNLGTAASSVSAIDISDRTVEHQYDFPITEGLNDQEYSKKATIETVTATDAKNIGSSPVTCTKTATYLPYDKEFMLSLISTYSSPLNWNLGSDISNSSKLNPLTCSLNGWKCQVNNLLCCVSCHATVLIRFPKDETTTEQEFLDDITGKYLDCIHSKHLDNCPWRLNPSKRSLSYDISSVNDSYELKKFAKRVVGLASMMESCKGLKTILYQLVAGSNDKFGTNINAVKQWCRLKNIAETNGELDSVIKLALTGWYVKFNSRQNVILQCDCCGSESIIPKDGSAQNDYLFDFIDDHNFHWCCYVQKESGRYSFETLLDFVQVDINDQKTTFQDVGKSLKQLISSVGSV